MCVYSDLVIKLIQKHDVLKTRSLCLFFPWMRTKKPASHDTPIPTQIEIYLFDLFAIVSLYKT